MSTTTWYGWLTNWFTSTPALPQCNWELGEKPVAIAIFGPAKSGKAALAEQLWKQMEKRTGSKRLLRFDELTNAAQAVDALADHSVRQYDSVHAAQHCLLLATAPQGDSRTLRTHLKRLFESRCRMLTWSAFCLRRLDDAPWWRVANFDRIVLSKNCLKDTEELGKLHSAFFAKRFPREQLTAHLEGCSAFLVLDTRTGDLSQM